MRNRELVLFCEELKEKAKRYRDMAESVTNSEDLMMLKTKAETLLWCSQRLDELLGRMEEDEGGA